MSLLFKKIKKLFPLVTLGISPIVLSSCSSVISTVNIGYFDYWSKYNTLQSYITNQDSDAFKWIIQREISIRFTLKPTDGVGNNIYTFGTAWIYGKDSTSTNNYTYYLATNIHVASNLNELNWTTDRYIQSTQGNGLVKKYTLIGVSFNFISDSSLSSLRKNDDGSMKYLWEANGTDSYINLWTNSSNKDDETMPSIVYTATKNLLFGNNTMVDHYTNKNIENPAIDFALIKVDFSNVVNQNNSQNESVQTFLSSYDSNPTKFISSASIDYSKPFYLGGFPEAETYWKPNTSVAWIGLSDITLTPDNIFHNVDYQINNEYCDFSDPTSIAPIKNSLEYVKKEGDQTYLWYRNTAEQLVIGDGSIGGGASGSMLVQETSSGNYRVVGIYWGAYDYITSRGISYNYAAVDLFISNGYTYSYNKRGITINYNYPSYNLIESIDQNVMTIKKYKKYDTK